MSPAPRTLRLDAHRTTLLVEWNEGAIQNIPHGVLRRLCPCAECRQLRRDGSSPDDSARLVGVEAYGPNAVRLFFSDGHSRGIFPFEYLRTLAGE